MKRTKRIFLAFCMMLGLLMVMPEITGGARTEAAANGWYRDSQGRYYYLKNQGRVTGWQQIGNKWYYFSGSGYRQTGWVQSGRQWYYLDPSSGTMCTGWRRINGKYYFFNTGGTMRTGWLRVNSSTTYYLKSDGSMATGWQKIGNSWYCFSGAGKLYKNTFLKNNKTGKYFFVNANGVMATGWMKRGQDWYYFNGNGEMVTGWIKLSGKQYYLNSNGKMRTGWVSWRGIWYYLKPGSGEMMTNSWLSYKNKWYYLNANGSMKTGWLSLGGKMYFMGSDGIMYANQWRGDNYLGADGAWIKNYSADVSKLKVARTTTQIIKIEARGTSCVLTLHQKYGSTWKQVGRCVGYVGLGGVNKRSENDKKTPSGVFAVRQAFGTLANPGTTLKYTKVDGTWYWCRNKASKYYNTLVRSTAYKPTSADLRIAADKTSYAYALDIGYNTGRDTTKGSAIFLHTGNSPTKIGGIAISRGALATTLRWVRSGAKVIIGTPSQIAKY